MAEAADEIGGRLRFETRLPGLAGWGRVLDWRRGQLEQLANVNIYRGNRLDGGRRSSSSATRTSSSRPARAGRGCCIHRWRCRWGAWRTRTSTPPTTSPPARASKGRSWSTTSTTTTWAACSPSISPAAAIAVSYVTPAGHASAWTIMSNEQPQIHRALAAAGIALHTLSRVVAFDARRGDPRATSSPTPRRACRAARW